jgi:hypothetical protein
MFPFCLCYPLLLPLLLCLLLQVKGYLKEMLRAL